MHVDKLYTYIIVYVNVLHNVMYNVLFVRLEISAILKLMIICDI